MDVCRFCLGSDTTQDNPFLAPCKCSGSVKYVHRYCIREWLAITTNPDFRIRCQLCKNLYSFPNRYPLETIPYITNDSLWMFLMTPIAPSFGVLYTYHLLLAIFYDHSLLTLNPHSLLYIFLHKYGYDVCVFATVIAYLSYYHRFGRMVQNQRIYMQYTFFERHTFIFFSCFLGSLMYSLKFPLSKELFGMLLVAIMPQYYHIHIRTLEKINREGRLI